MNKSVRKKYWICFLIIGLVILIDQVLKIWIKTHFAIGENVPLIGNWSKLYFIENVGMAFGMAFGGVGGKIFLSSFRLVASIFIIFFLVKLIKKDSRMLLLVSISLIFVGAVGNLIDSCFYGLIFSESTHTQVATMFPEGGGYGTFFCGKVVDMFYFPICEWTWPGWIPVIGGTDAEFFNAIFNVADAAICVGVGLLLIDQLFFSNDKTDKQDGTENVQKDTPISEEKRVEPVADDKVEQTSK